MNAEPSSPFLETVIRYATRLICLGAVAWSGLMVVDVAGSFRSLWRSGGEGAGNAVAFSSIPDQWLPSDGYWSFANTDLSVQTIGCDDVELERRLENLLAMEGSETVSKPDASHLVALAKSNGATRQACPAGWLWEFAQAGIRVRLVTTDSNQPCIVVAAVAIRDAEQWQLTMFKPQPPLSDHLLPLPAEARTICARRNDANALQMELIDTSQTAEQLLARWRSAGWDIRHTPWGDDQSFSYLCVRGDQVVYTWSNTAAGSRTIMFSSSPHHPSHNTLANGHRLQTTSIRQEIN